MSESPSSTLRNTRKHFVKCVDCRTQTLPQNASGWTTAGSLNVSGRTNDGALCSSCANKRRKTLGLPVAEHIEDPSPAPLRNATAKRLKINRREYCWEVSNLEAVLTKWRDEYLNPTFRKRDIKTLVVIVNDELVRTRDFSSVPISDGDTIVIMVGGVAGG